MFLAHRAEWVCGEPVKIGGGASDATGAGDRGRPFTLRKGCVPPMDLETQRQRSVVLYGLTAPERASGLGGALGGLVLLARDLMGAQGAAAPC